MTFVGRASVPFVWSAVQIDLWWDPLHMMHMALPFFAHCRAACPRLRQRKHLFVAFNFSILSVVPFTCWHSWAQCPLVSQNAQKASGVRLVGLLDLWNLVLTWKAVAVGTWVGAEEDSPRMF